MSHSELLPIPPIDTAEDPVHSAFDLLQRWRALMGPLGFGQQLLWIGFVGADRRLMKTMSQVRIGGSSRRRVSRTLMPALRDVVDGLPPECTVALLMTGPGRGPISPTDRLWAKSLTEAAAHFDVPLLPIFRANDEAILQVDAS